MLQLPLWSSLESIVPPRRIPNEALWIPLTYLSHLVEAKVFGLHLGVVHGVKRDPGVRMASGLQECPNCAGIAPDGRVMI